MNRSLPPAQAHPAAQTSPSAKALVRRLSGVAWVRFAVVVATALLAPPAAGQARDTIDVLFIGNSYVYYNNLADQLEGLSRAMEASPSCGTSRTGTCPA